LRATGGNATGVHRAGRGLLDALRDTEIATEVIAPRGVGDARVDRRTFAFGGNIGDRLWEQALPLTTHGRLLLSLTNTAPLFARNNVVMLHDLAFRVGPQWFSARGRRNGALALAVAKHARALLVPSEQVALEVRQAGIERPKIYTIRPAVDPTFARASQDEVERVRTLFRLDRPYVVHIGWGDPRKDVHTLISAHLDVAVDVPHELVLVGRHHASFPPVELPIAKTITLLGSVTDADLVPLLSGASALAYPSLYEGFGLPPIEALACGTPAIVSDIPVLHESTLEQAYFVPPGDQVAWASAILQGLKGDLRPGTPPVWKWEDAAGQLEGALRALGFE
jgi:glycosyltransferase involved in cell wall biosynthesis